MPLQLLKLEPEHEIAVIEMGMSHAGEITALAKLAQPDCGVVTLVAPVHLEYFDSIAAIAKAKRELIEALPPSGIAILNADDPYVSQFGSDFSGKSVFFGVHKSADVTARDIEALRPLGSTFDVVFEGKTARATPALARRAQHLQRAWREWPWACSMACPSTKPLLLWPRSPRATSAARCWNSKA